MINKKNKNAVHPRGTVMILVVAVLALLAVIGTVYIVSARAGRNTSSAMSATANLDLARDSVVNTVRQTMLNTLLDANGNVGTTALTGSPTSYGNLAAHNYDYPDLGVGNSSFPNTSIKNEAWLVAHIHNQGNIAVNDLSLLTATPFNPATGNYSGISNTLFIYSSPLTTVVADQIAPANDATHDDAPTARADAYINLLPFSEASGIRYRFGVRIIDTNRMANVNTGSPDDTVAGTTTDKTGTYFTSMRLAPINSDMPDASDNYFNYSGDNTFAANLHQSLPAGSGLGRAGVSGPNGTFTVAGWQQQMLHIEKPNDPDLALFEPSDELELRAYGEYGTSYHIRLASLNDTTTSQYCMWPNTFSCAANAGGTFSPTGGSVFGNPRRRNYTMYSFSDEIRPVTDPAQNLIFTCGNTITPWPFQNHTANTPTINRVPVNLSPNNSADTLAHLATALATSMIYTANSSYLGAVTDYNGAPAFPAAVDGTVPFTQDEVCAYAVNYMESRWSGMVPDNTIATASAYFLPAGPSLIDGSGICVRTATAATSPIFRDYTGGTNDLKSAGSTTYLGYSAQPFINEVAIYGTAPDTMTPPTITDMAIELYNPYNTGLSLKGYSLKVGSQSILLTGSYIPARSFFVITTAQGHYGGTLGAIQHITSLTTPLAGALTVTLYRPYAPRGATSLTGLAEIDKTDFTILLTPGTTYNTVPSDHSWARDNLPTPPAGTSNWGAAFNASASVRASTVGALNGVAAGTPVHALYDRFAGSAELPLNAAQQSGFANIADFNHTMRICHRIDSTGNSIVNGLVTDQLYAIISGTPAAPFSNMALPKEAQIYFDFMARPQVYSSTPTTAIPTDFNASLLAGAKQGDIRAVRLLSQIAMIDRVSDSSIDIGAGLGTFDINKIRLPGQNNINTASGTVIRAIPNISFGAKSAGKDPDVLVANILAYRARLGTGNVLATYNGKASTVDYSDQTKFPGYGFRSLAEVLVPITDYIGGTPATIDARDSIWASIYNLCTVRSDTFILYGYLEAVRVNPNYVGHNNASDWYGNVTDDPHNTTIPNLRVAKRRFIAILDRSWCNYPRSDTANFALPRVVAIKDLPQ